MSPAQGQDVSAIAGESVPVVVSVREEADVAICRQRLRDLARERGFSTVAVEALATAVSEVARNIVIHTRGGSVTFQVVHSSGGIGIAVVARDQGPGIPDVERALEDGFSTAGGLGLGLSGARRLVDEFEVESEVGRGTIIRMTKWLGR